MWVTEQSRPSWMLIQKQLDADPEPGHLSGVGLSLNVLCLRRFLKEGLGDTRSSWTGRRGQGSVSAKTKMLSSDCPNLPVPESGNDAFIAILLLFIDQAFLAHRLLGGSLALCIVFH